MSNNNHNDPLDTRRVLLTLWTRSPVIIVVVAVVSIGTYLLSSMKTDLYRAKATIQVIDPNTEALFNANQVRIDPARELDTQLALVRSADVTSAVRTELGPLSGDVKSLGAKNVGNTNLIALSAVSPIPETAQQAANTFAEVYVDNRRDQVSSTFAKRAEELRAKAADIDSQITGIDNKLDANPPNAEAELLRSQRTTLLTQQADLRDRATQFEVEAATRTGNVAIAESAALPRSPFAPTPARDASVAAILALIMSVAGVLIVDRLNDRLTSSEDLEEVIDPVPVLGHIPVHSENKKGVRRMPRKTQRVLVRRHSISAEAYRALRAAVQFSSLSKTRKTLVVTSSDQREGKTTVTANLAVTLAESGLRVVVISADLRRPTLAPVFGVEETTKGLTTVLRGEAPLLDCLVPVSLASGQTLYLLPSGPLPPNPAEVLASARMRDVVEALAQADTDYVLIDTPPVLAVSDVMALAQFTDGVILLAAANHTKRQHLSRAIEQLRQVNADIVGVILNGIPTRGRLGGYYGSYGYGRYGYRSAYISDFDDSVEFGREPDTVIGSLSDVPGSPKSLPTNRAASSTSRSGGSTATDEAVSSTTP